MFERFWRKKVQEPQKQNVTAEASVDTKPPQKKGGFFRKLALGLGKTRQTLTHGLADLLLGKKTIDAEVLEILEQHLLMADVGLRATEQIIADITAKTERRELHDLAGLLQALEQELVTILEPVAQPLPYDSAQPFVILMVGINGAGKTTTAGKLANCFQREGKRVMLAAGDTFRAAAVEQLLAWGDRNQVKVIQGGPKADSAAVIYDALASAKAKGMDILLADTAGRLHTQGHLMEELAKVKRVMSKLDEHAPHEVLLVLDASIGQNALVQAREFHRALGVTGLCITKLDGTAKAGVLLALAKELAIPIRYVGVGEGVDDLRPFRAKEFAQALLGRDERESK